MTTSRMLWPDGLPLAPQHFQLADRLSHEGLEARLRMACGARWGLRRLALDARALAEGTIRVEALDAVLADGTVLSVGPGSEVVIEDRPLVGFGPDRHELVVHVAVVRERADRHALAGATPRLRRVERRAIDAHTETPAEPLDVELGVPVAKIVLGHEAREDLETLPICVVRRDGSGVVRATDTIVGPLLSIGASAPLMARLSRLVERLGARRAALFSARHERDAGGVDVDPSDLSRFLLASAVATHHPVLRHVLTRSESDPEALFEKLLALAGALAVLATDGSLELPDLDPLAPHAALTALFDRIEALLAATARDRSRTVTLEARSDGLHFARLDDETARGERFFLAVRSVLASREVESSLGGLAKVASYGEIAGVLESATPGAPLRVVHRPPPEIPLRAGETCFELPAGDRHVRAALAERGIAVYLPARSFDPAHTRLTLVAVTGPAASRTDRHPSTPLA